MNASSVKRCAPGRSTAPRGAARAKARAAASWSTCSSSTTSSGRAQTDHRSVRRNRRATGAAPLRSTSGWVSPVYGWDRRRTCSRTPCCRRSCVLSPATVQRAARAPWPPRRLLSWSRIPRGTRCSPASRASARRSNRAARDKRFGWMPCSNRCMCHASVPIDAFLRGRGTSGGIRSCPAGHGEGLRRTGRPFIGASHTVGRRLERNATSPPRQAIPRSDCASTNSSNPCSRSS